MAMGKKAYPRATVKKVIKAHSNMTMSKNADVTIFLNYVLFMETYAPSFEAHCSYLAASLHTDE
ncbi:hypothetical protein E4U09_000166 [Claviceps aff. purpurea]|uniref:Transcription factor CBF/NF-Y/archaeal histone domain-containing protein n=1 Tax=Claviceps aff. purpurea TaxID=1967640 RepID=A0A9P7QJL7_9HYPO|nr:hypothetical protein E4U09_000166 [Claviceps aff. purpurea]